jgi:type IV pilus assembly protein PilC
VRFVGSGDLTGSVVQILVVLVPIYFASAIIIFAMQSKHGEGWRALIERLLHVVPILGKARRELALARLTMALEALINAGVTVIEAWDLAARVSGSPSLRRTVSDWHSSLQAGQTPAEMVSACGKFPDLFVSQYMSGEVSGKLDQVLHRLTRYYRDEGTRKVDALAQWTPRVAYLVIALLIAYWVINFYVGRFRQLQDVMNGF